MGRSTPARTRATSAAKAAAAGCNTASGLARSHAAPPWSGAAKPNKPSSVVSWPMALALAGSDE